MDATPDIDERDFARYADELVEPAHKLAEAFHVNVSKPLLLSEQQRLSPRERECLLWVMRGLRNIQIADRLGTHPKTVEKQLANVRRKLSARTNAQAATRALLLDLIEP